MLARQMNHISLLQFVEEAETKIKESWLTLHLITGYKIKIRKDGCKSYLVPTVELRKLVQRAIMLKIL